MADFEKTRSDIQTAQAADMDLLAAADVMTQEDSTPEERRAAGDTLLDLLGANVTYAAKQNVLDRLRAFNNRVDEPGLTE